MSRGRRRQESEHRGFNEAAGVDPADVSNPEVRSNFGVIRFNEAAGVDPADVSREPVP